MYGNLIWWVSWKYLFLFSIMSKWWHFGNFYPKWSFWEKIVYESTLIWDFVCCMLFILNITRRNLILIIHPITYYTFVLCNSITSIRDYSFTKTLNKHITTYYSHHFQIQVIKFQIKAINMKKKTNQ